MTSLLTAISSPSKMGGKGRVDALLRQNRSNAEQRWALREAEQCVRKAWEHFYPVLFLPPSQDSSCWKGSSQRSEDSSRCFIPASQFSLQALPIPFLWEDWSSSAIPSSLIRVGCIVPASQVVWGCGLRCKAQVCLQWLRASLAPGLTIPVQEKWWNTQANLWGHGDKHPTLLEREEEENSSLFLELPNIRAGEAQILWFLTNVPQAHLRTSERNLHFWFNSAELNEYD